MGPGDIVHGRYAIEAVAGEGGMGVVYRARDLETGEPVALKCIREASGETVTRFAHEARFLAELRHPHIVRYVTHAAAPSGDLYLVMEWLDGESLDDRLARGRLEIDEATGIARRLAEALSAAHARGIVHRDVKPSNVFLVGRRADEVKLLDFGIARDTSGMAPLTYAGSAIGTPGYMSPEQASGEREAVQAESDVFSLGCVLFECLTGRPAFLGRHLMALLAKLLLEEAPRVREIRPEVPAALDALVARMLSKDAAARPADGAAVLLALDRLSAPEDEAPPSLAASTRAGVVTTQEKRLVAVIALLPADGAQATTLAAPPPAPATLVRAPILARQAASPFKAKVEELANGRIVCLLVGSGPATDQAAMAAQCALQIRRRLPGAPMILLMGRSEDTSRLPVGEVLERAASMLDRAIARGRTSPLAAVEPIPIDEVTRALLDVRFEVVEEEGRALLSGERELGDHARLLLGKPAPFVGRERELQNLAGLIEESFEDRRACAVLVTAPAGMGKSRLRQELVEVLKRRWPEMLSPTGRGDSMGAGSTFAVLGSALRGATGIAGGEPLEARRHKLSSFVETFVAGDKRRRVTELLGEMIGAPFPDEDSPRLRAARQSPALLMEQIEAAFLDLARAMTAARPVLLLVEDLHWGDEPSVKLLDAALRELADQPFVVVAFARPEVQTVFPKLWATREVHQVRLRELHRKAAESLVRAVLGASIDAAAVEAVVDRAAGNAFYLEELIRAVAEGRQGALPDTVLGMVEARLRGLAPEVRRLLRAASVFGEAFWKSGVLALLGEDAAGSGEPDPFLPLCDLELCVRRSKPRFATEEEYAFRHALLGEGAYAMLPERDRQVGHKRAAEWLEAAGERDLVVLAEHFHRGGESRQAIELYLRAGENTRAATVSCAALRLFGIDLPASEDERRTALEAGMAEDAAELQRRPPASRLDAPEMTDEAALAAERLLMTAALPAYFTSSSLYGLMMRAWLDLLRRAGHSDISAMSYVFYGTFLMGFAGQTGDAYAFGMLGVALLERRPNRAIACRVIETMAGNIAFLHEPIREVLARFPDALRAGVEVGDWVHAAYICAHLASMRLFLGDDLGDVEAQMVENAPIVRRSRDLFMVVTLHVCQDVVWSLRDATGEAASRRSPTNADETWNGEAIHELAEREDFATFGGVYHTLRLLSCAALGSWDEALREAVAAEAKGPHAPGQFFVTQLALLGALARLQVKPPDEIAKDAQLAGYREDLRTWAASCPATFRAGHLLVEAEVARVRGEDSVAGELYAEAIGVARARGLTRDEALASELGAGFHAARGRAEEAGVHLEAARGAYARWGALAKVRRLDDRAAARGG